MCIRDRYYPGVPLCYGGVMALDGQTGHTLWQHWTRRIILSVDCSTDLDVDGVNDCLISGKGGVSIITFNQNEGHLIILCRNNENYIFCAT